MFLVVLRRHPATQSLLAGVILEYSGERQASDSAFRASQAEYTRGADIVRRRRQVDNEGLRKKVGPLV